MRVLTTQDIHAVSGGATTEGGSNSYTFLQGLWIAVSVIWLNLTGRGWGGWGK